MQLVESYITIHDQGILLECEANGQFSNLSSYKYLFVGPRAIDQLSEDVLAKTIVCRNYSPNVEHVPQFYDFTSWYVLAKHDLMQSKYALCLQYDMTVIDPFFEEKCIHALATNPGMIAFVTAYPQNWMLQIPEFEETYRRGLAVKGMSMEMMGDFPQWPCTQGTAWRSAALKDFMLWFEPLFEVFMNHTFAGHLAERMVKPYSFLTHPEQYIGGMIQHNSQDCHGTGAWMRGDMDLYNRRSQEFMCPPR